MSQFMGFYSRSTDGTAWLFPAYTLVNKRGRRVRLIALVHQGYRSYYKHLLEREIEPWECHGAHVLKEGANTAKGERVRSEDEYTADTLLSIIKEVSLICSKDSGIVDQRKVFTERRMASWINADISRHELCRIIAQDPRALEAAKCLVAEARRQGITAFAASRDSTFKRIGPDVMSEGMKSCGLFGPFILKRNEALLARIAEIPGGDLVVPWGAGHAEGLFKALEADGYELREVTWYPALPAYQQ